MMSWNQRGVGPTRLSTSRHGRGTGLINHPPFPFPVPAFPPTLLLPYPYLKFPSTPGVQKGVFCLNSSSLLAARIFPAPVRGQSCADEEQTRSESDFPHTHSNRFLHKNHTTIQRTQQRTKKNFMLNFSRSPSSCSAAVPPCAVLCCPLAGRRLLLLLHAWACALCSPPEPLPAAGIPRAQAPRAWRCLPSAP